MAFNTDTNKKTTRTKANKAEAWLNVEIIDAKGNSHRLRAGIPLSSLDVTERSLIKKFATDPDKVHSLTGTVRLAIDHAELPDIAF